MKGRQNVSRRLSLQSICMNRPSTTDEELGETSRSGRRASRSNSHVTSTGRSSPIAAKSNYKVVVLGSARVGKTSLVTQFVEGTFSDRYRPTVDEMHAMELDCDRTLIRLDILDTGGSNEFPAMRSLAINGADGFILVCSVDDPSSLEAVDLTRNQINEIKGMSIPVVVVLNKTDLLGSEEHQNQLLCLEMVESLVTCDWGHGFVAVSAKQNLNVIKVFQELFNQAKSRITLSPALRKRRLSLPGRSHVVGQAAGLSPGRSPHLLISPQPHPHKIPVKRNSCTMS